MRSGAEAPGGGPSPLGRVQVDDRPLLAVIAREGDPQFALAFAASHARGPELSAALSGLVAARLEAAGLAGVEARAHGLGIELTWLTDTPDDAARFFRAVHTALSAPVTPDEPALGRARRESSALRALPFAGPADAAAAACSGEPGTTLGAPELDLRTPAGIRELDAARSAVYRAGAAAFGALGPPAFLDAAADALASGADWPGTRPDTDPWPADDVVAVDGPGPARRLTLAIRVPDPDAAISAASTLARPRSDLLARMGALLPAWTLERAVAVPRPRGACLRLDLAAPRGDPPPTSAEIGRVAALVEITARAALERGERGALDESLLRPSDPRQGAALAAWRSLAERERADSERTVLVYVPKPGESAVTAELASAREQARARLQQPTFELATRVEAGQGQLWVLLASPCGTALDGSEPGALALLLRTIAERLRNDAVTVEPWVTPDGVGLLAHAPRAAASESPTDHARRVARVLGRALAERTPGPELGIAREALSEELGGRPFPGWAAALDGLAPEHPSLLEPRGTWDHLAALTSESLERARRTLAASPLRLSVLANASTEQVDTVARELESWLLPLRAEPARQCPATTLAAPRSGELQLGPPQADPREGAYVGAVLAVAGASAARALEATVFLLNRPGGWLERALTVPGLGGKARAHALGGARRPALLIDVRALPEELPRALSEVRAVLDQLAEGALTEQELRLAESELLRRDREARLDPRRRIVELWRGTQPPALSLAELRTLLAPLGTPSHWVVAVEPPK